MTLAVLASEFDALPIEEQLDYVQTLWERIAQRPESLPVPDWHRTIIRERLAAHADGSDESVEWVNARAELLDK